MPIFEYECQDCRKISSFLEKSASKAAKEHVCEHCGSKKTKKIFSTFSAKTAESKISMSSGGCGSSCRNKSCPMAG